MKPKVLKYYYVPMTNDGSVLYWLTSQNREHALCGAFSYDQINGTRRTWPQLYRAGWRIIKVRIVPVEDQE